MGPGARWAVEGTPQLCGEDDDDSGFRPAHRVLADIHRRHRHLRLTRTRAVFEVLAQKVTTVEARASYRALVYAFGEAAPGPASLVVPPSPRVLARTPYWAFHRFGIERRQADVIILAALSANRLEETVAMDVPSAYGRLRAFPDVGPSTAAKVALVALGDPDAVPVGDYNLPHEVGYLLEGTARSTDERNARGPESPRRTAPDRGSVHCDEIRGMPRLLVRVPARMCRWRQSDVRLDRYTVDPGCTRRNHHF
ncbi:MAG: DNA-3-methyladenine glycosylase 2 family protein [Candidatus Dormibacteraceae bacterium]